MSRMLVISDTDLRELVAAGEERIRIHGTHASHRALATAQLALDTMIPDAEDILGWTNASKALKRIAAADLAQHPDLADSVTILQGMLRQQLEAFGCNPLDSRTGLGAFGALITTAGYAATLHDGGAHDYDQHRAVSTTLQAMVMAAARFAPSEVRL